MGSNKVGRPLEDLSSLPNDWYHHVIDLYSEGGSDAEIKAMIYRWRGSFSNDLWDRWMRETPEFSESIRGGRLLSEAWWQKNGRTNLTNKDFSYTGWYMNMKNRFGWMDRSDHTTNGESIQPPKIVFKKFKTDAE